MRRLKRKWIMIGSIGLIAVIAFVVVRKNRDDGVSYREAIVTRDTVETTILSTGTVQPQNRLEIKPPIAGRVEEVLVNEGARVKRGQILAWMSSTERAALLDAARARGIEERQKWEELYRPTPILAPIDGTLILRSVEPGQSFTAADSIFVMSDRLTIKAQVDETDIAQVKLRQKARVVLDAYPGHSLPAHVDQIAFDSKTVNNVTTYQVDVLPEVTPAFMRSGMTANVTFEISSKKNVLVLPAEAVKVKDGKSFVLVVAKKGKPIEKEVTLGLSDGKRTEVLSGLEDGDRLLVVKLKFGSDAKKNGSPFAPTPPRRR